jgi:hypothetical protein
VVEPGIVTRGEGGGRTYKSIFCGIIGNLYNKTNGPQRFSFMIHELQLQKLEKA